MPEAQTETVTARLTRAEVAERLRCSVRSVQRLDGRNLHPIRNDDGSISYDAAEVDRHARATHSESTPDIEPPTREGALASRIFAAFAAGASPREAVIQLAVEPDVIQSHYAKWHALDAGFALTAAERATLEKIMGRVSTAEDFLSRMNKIAAAVNDHTKFRYPCATCGQPVQASATREWKAITDANTFAGWSHEACERR